MKTAYFVCEDGSVQRWSLARDSRGWIATEPDGNRRHVGNNLTEARILLAHMIAPSYGMKLETIA